MKILKISAFYLEKQKSFIPNAMPSVMQFPCNISFDVRNYLAVCSKLCHCGMYIISKVIGESSKTEIILPSMFVGWFCETSNNSELDVGSNKMSQISSTEMSASTDLFSHKHLFWTHQTME